MRWIYRHRFLLIIAAILAALVILFAVSNRLQGDDTAIGKAARSFVTLVQTPVNSLVGMISGEGGEGNSGSEVDQLKKQVESLKEKLQIASLTRDEYEELKILSESLNLTGGAIDKKPIAANVITYDNTDTFNIFTIDVGTEMGIGRDAVVLCGDGLIGRVLSSSKGWAKVVSITDENNKIGFQVKEQKDGKDVTFLGICEGSGDGYLTGRLLDETGFAKVGDEVKTSGLGGIYPEGITVGKVIKAEYTDKSQLMELVIEPMVYFKGLKKVVVLV